MCIFLLRDITKPPRITYLEPPRDGGGGDSLLCKHRLPLTQSGLIHRESSQLCQMLMEAFLWVEKQATQLKGGGDSQSWFGRLSGTQKQTTKGTQEGTGHCQASRSVPSFSSRGTTISPLSTPSAEPPAQVGSIATRFNVLARARWSRGLPGSPAFPGISTRPRGAGVRDRRGGRPSQ